MAERAHEIPAKYGDVLELFHPRMRSYGRRIEAALPGTITLVAAIAFLAYKRPALPYLVLVLIICFFAGLSLYSVLKPTIVAITKTHVLRARIFGWHAVERKDMDHTIFVEKLYGKKAHGQDLSNVVAKLKYRSFPSMWALDKQGKSLLRLDGRVWDAKTMSTVASKLSDQTTVYKKANVLDIDRLHHGLITFTELHPGWKSATMAILAVLIVVIFGGAAILPEVMPRSIHLIP